MHYFAASPAVPVERKFLHDPKKESVCVPSSRKIQRFISREGFRPKTAHYSPERKSNMKMSFQARQRPALALLAGLGGLLGTANLVCARPFGTNGAPSVYSWIGISGLAASADGVKLAVASVGYAESIQVGGASPFPTPIYVSTNAGATWNTDNSPSNYWAAVASSADGKQLVAVPCALATGLDPFYGGGDGSIYTSSDAGMTWAPANAPGNTWTAVAASADGTRLVAASCTVYNGGDGLIYVSTNSGASWAPSTAPYNDWSALASSADGTKLVATGGPSLVVAERYASAGHIFTSTNGGAMWTTTHAPINTWSLVASSADGTRLVAAASTYGGDGSIYVSTDSGATWSQTSAPRNPWYSVALSADGTRIAAVSANGGPLYFSTDSGATWTTTGVYAHEADGPVVLSADGYRLIGASEGLTVFALPYLGQWRVLLSIAASGARVVLSWPVPSTSFVLQQNSDLTSANWVDVIDAPSLNFTNLYNQLTLPPPSGKSFYRLKQQ
jgi:hypothetical protein